MPNQIFTVDTVLGGAADLGADPNAIGLVARDIAVISPFTVLNGSGFAQTLLVEGAVSTSWFGQAVVLSGLDANVVVSRHGSIATTARSVSSALQLGGSGSQLHNDGEITGASGVSANGADSRIVNNGTIAATGVGNSLVPEAAIFLGYGSSSAGQFSVINSGRLFGGSNADAPEEYLGLSIGVIQSNNVQLAVTVINSGLVHGAILLRSGADVVRNTGQISGDVTTGNQADRVVNWGLIDGRVDLGSDDDVYRGGGGSVTDSVLGGTGNDTLFAGRDDDEVQGGDGSDVIRGGAGDDFLLGGLGADDIRAGTGDDTVSGGGDDDFIAGASGDDVLDGGQGDDTIKGGSGEDTIRGTAGRDDLTGGTDGDEFVYASAADAGNGATRDIIRGFRSGEDVINLFTIDADEAAAGNQVFTFIGNAVFSATAGELRYSGDLLAGDTNGDGLADFQIRLFRAPNITADDIIL